MTRNLAFGFVFLFIILATACSPKFIIHGQRIQGRVVDDETGEPIEEAAVAIRWFRNGDHRDQTHTNTLKAAQDISDSEGFFHVPAFPNQNYAMGVYKKGYVCWSNQQSFLKTEAFRANNLGSNGENPVVEDGMEIRLKPFKESYSQKRHAGFVIGVASECTASHNGAFNKAIKSEHTSWVDNLRNSFKKIFRKKHASEQNSDP